MADLPSRQSWRPRGRAFGLPLRYGSPSGDILAWGPVTTSREARLIEPNETAAFFGATYDEAHALLVEARDFVRDGPAGDGDAATPLERLTYCQESLRLTTRLVQVMAWLLARKAVHAGELSAAEAATARYALGGRRVCLDARGEAVETLPAQLRDLLARSRALYQRIERLDGMARRAAR